VILEAGGGGTSAARSAVQAALPATIRVCAYDRAGPGKSGILARLYFHEYPDSVAGMLPVDPTDQDSVVFNGRLNRWIMEPPAGIEPATC
jgi:hypothetical protein